jgi:hypothetical protein
MGSIAAVRPDRVFRRDSRTPASCSIQSLLGRQLDDSTTMKEPITCSVRVQVGGPRFCSRLSIFGLPNDYLITERWGAGPALGFCQHHHHEGCPSFAGFAKLGTTG